MLYIAEYHDESGRAKKLPERVKWVIVELRKKGFPLEAIGSEFGLDTTCINNICRKCVKGQGQTLYKGNSQLILIESLTNEKVGTYRNVSELAKALGVKRDKLASRVYYCENFAKYGLLIKDFSVGFKYYKVMRERVNIKEEGKKLFEQYDRERYNQHFL